MLYLSLKSHYKTEQKNYSYTFLCLLAKMKPTLVSSDIAIYTVSSKAMCEDIDSCPGNPTSRGARVSNTSDTLTNTRIEVFVRETSLPRIYVPGEFRTPQGSEWVCTRKFLGKCWKTTNHHLFLFMQTMYVTLHWRKKVTLYWLISDRNIYTAGVYRLNESNSWCLS